MESEHMEVEDVQNEEESANILENVLPYLFYKGFLTDIECRKIACTHDVTAKQSAMLEIIVTKNSSTAQSILKILRDNIHPLLNCKILKMIFSYLNPMDVKSCSLVCKKWNAVALSLVDNLSSQCPAKRQKITTDTRGDEPGALNLLLQQLTSKKEEINVKIDDPELMLIQESVLKLLLSADSEIVDTLVSTIKGTYSKRNAEETGNTTDESFVVEEETKRIVAKALSNEKVVCRIFEFLPLKDLKNCRMVSRKWNSISEINFGQRTRLRFSPTFRPRDFLKVKKYMSRPNEQFSNVYILTDFFSIEEIAEFFSKWGENMKNLHLLYHWSNGNLAHGLSACLSLTNNLTVLRVDGMSSMNFIPPEMMIPWEQIRNIKTLSLNQVAVKISTDIDSGRIRPSKIHLHHVHFFLDGEKLEEIPLNDFVDFSNAKEISISSCRDPRKLFDWKKDKLDVNKMTCNGIRFKKWRHSNAKVNLLKLSCCLFSKRTEIQMRQLFFRDGTIDLSFLPPTLEKIWFGLNTQIMLSRRQPIYLPQLKFLSYMNDTNLKWISHLYSCPALEDMEIMINKLNLAWIPKQVKRLKAKMNSSFEFLGLHVLSVDLDLLILDLNADLKPAAATNEESENSMEDSMEDSIEESIDIAIEIAIANSIENAIQRAAEDSLENPTEDSTVNAGENSTENPAENSIESSTVNAGENLMEKLTNLLAKIRPKLLVMKFKGTCDDDAFTNFLMKSNHVDKIVVQCWVLENCGDITFSFYEFVDQVKKAITSEEFEEYHNLIDADCD